MTMQRQTLAMPSGTAFRSHLPHRRAQKRFLQHLTCRSTTQKVQAPSHSAFRSQQLSWARKHPQLQMLSEMARSPAAPGLLFTAAGVKGFSIFSKAASKTADRLPFVVEHASVKAEGIGDQINRQLRQASDSAAAQTEVSQEAFEEWKVLMADIISEETSKLQTDLDDASVRVRQWQKQWQQQLSEFNQQADSFVRQSSPFGQQATATTTNTSKRIQLNSHPMSLPSFQMPQLESGWLVDAFQQRFPDVGAPSAWPRSFSIMSTSDSTSVSDEEEARSPTSPASLASHFMQEAQHLFERASSSASDSLDRPVATFVQQFREGTQQLKERGQQLKNRTQQLTVPSFEAFSFSAVSSPRSRSHQTSSPSSQEHPAASSGSTQAASSPSHSAVQAEGAAERSTDGTASRVPSVTVQGNGLITTGKASDNPPKASGQAQSSAAKASAGKGQTLPNTPLQASQPAAHSPAPKNSKSLSTASANGLSTKAPVKADKAFPDVPVQAEQSAVSTSAQHQDSASQAAAQNSSPSGRTHEQGSLPSASSSPHGHAPAPSVSPSSQSTGDIGKTWSGPPLTPKGFASWFAAKHIQSPPDQQSAASTSAQTPPAASLQQHAPSTSDPSSIPSPSSSDANADAYQSNTIRPSAASAKDLAQSEQQKASVQSLADVSAQQQQQQQQASKPEAAPKPGQAVKERHQVFGQKAQQGDAQSKGKPQKSVRVVRPEPTPNWRTPRPLTPPPGPLQQGHPLSEAAGAAGNSPAGPGTTFEADPTMARALSGDAGKAQDLSAVRPDRKGAAAAHAPSSSQPTDYLDSNDTPTTAAATAVEHDAETTVIDSIPWGSRGSATAQGRAAQLQVGGGSSGVTGGGLGGSGGGGGRQPGGGGEEEGDSKESGWGGWWFSALIAGGAGGTAAYFSSSFRQTIWEAYEAVKARFTTGAAQAQDTAQLATPQAAAGYTSDNEASFVTDDASIVKTHDNIKEDDAAWGIAEEYTGNGMAWPEAVSSNSDVARPTAGATIRFRGRM